MEVGKAETPSAKCGWDPRGMRPIPDAVTAGEEVLSVPGPSWRDRHRMAPELSGGLIDPHASVQFSPCLVWFFL